MNATSVAVRKALFRDSLNDLAVKRLVLQGKPATGPNVRNELRWMAALHESQGVFEAWTLKDLAEALMNGGVPATDFDQWVESVLENDEEEQALDWLACA